MEAAARTSPRTIARTADVSIAESHHVRTATFVEHDACAVLVYGHWVRTVFHEDTDLQGIALIEGGLEQSAALETGDLAPASTFASGGDQEPPKPRLRWVRLSFFMP